MGKSTLDVVRDARNDVARTIGRSMRALKLAIGKRSEEEIKAAFEMPQKEAPMWTHAALRIGSAFVTTQGQSAAPADRGGLQVVVVAPAVSVEAWQQSADAFRVATAPKPKVLDVPASKSERK